MPGGAYTLFLGPRASIGAAGGTIHPIDADSKSAEESAQAAAELLRSLGHRRGSPVALAIPSEWCFSASIALEGLPRKHRRQAMLYRLEEKLPLAAEEFVADFLEGRRQALGVAAATGTLAPIVSALRSRSINVSIICPTALLALPEAPRDADALLVRDNLGGVEAFTLEGGDLAAWQTLGGGETDQQLFEKMLHVRLGRPPRLAKGPDEPPMPRAARAATRILRGDATPTLNLRRDALQSEDVLGSLRRPVHAACIGLMLLAVTLIVAMLWRAHRYERLAAESEDRQRALFAAAFPDQAAPAAIRSRLASEELRLRGLGGVNSALPAQTPTLVVLHQLLLSLPTDLRYRIQELRATPDGFQLDGQSLSHRDADAIATSLRKIPRFQIEPPRSEQLSTAGVSFTISGAVSTPAHR